MKRPGLFMGKKTEARMNQYTDTDVEIMKTTEQNDIDTKRLFQQIGRAHV